MAYLDQNSDYKEGVGGQTAWIVDFSYFFDARCVSSILDRDIGLSFASMSLLQMWLVICRVIILFQYPKFK